MDTIDSAPVSQFPGQAPSQPSSRQSPDSPGGPFPLVVGVAGHKDYDEDADLAVRAAVRRLLGQLQDSYSHTPIQLMTALAEGADQLVAEEALALGLSLAAVLPMPIADYEETFLTSSGRERLHDLWGKAQLQIELPWITGAAQAREEVLQYEQAGLVIARFSHVLLLLWNGMGRWDPEADEADRHRQRGGTAHIAHLRAAGGSDSAVLGHSPVFPFSRTRLESGDHGLSFRIATPRRKSAGCIGEAGSLWRLEADGNEAAADDIADVDDAGLRRPLERRANTSWKAAEADLRQLDEANTMLAESCRLRAEAVAQSAERLLPRAALSGPGMQRSALDRIRQAYACADVFSQASQRCIYRTILGIAVILPSAVFAFELHAHYFPQPEMLLVYLATIGLPLAFYQLYIKRREWQNHFQDFRALAEALRVQLFWGLAGLPRAVTECYLRKHHHEMNWIRQALLGPALQSLAVAFGPVRQDMVMRFWIDDQFAYFSGTSANGTSRPGKAEQNSKIYRRCEFWANAVYVTGLCIGFAMLPVYHQLDRATHHLAIMSLALAPAIAAAISVVSEKRAFRDHAHQYARMGRLFGEAARLIRRNAHDLPQEFAAIVGDLGAEALAENGDWLLAHRERQVEPIKGG